MTEQSEPNNTKTDAIDFYWRPGCGFCSGLEVQLNKVNYPLNKINIWDDPEAAAYVRSVADGNEVVPTVVVAGNAMVNPSVGQVTDMLTQAAPHLLTD